MRKLGARHSLFVAEYLTDLNATQAAIRAGYSVRRARQTGFDLLQIPHVAAAVAAAQGQRIKRVEITAGRILERLDALADGAERDSDKIRANELLGKHLRLWAETVEHSGPNGGPLQVSISITRSVPRE